MVPVWVWILLWIFLFANFSFGVYYVIRHGLDALTKAGKTGSEISDILSRMEDKDSSIEPEDASPYFTRPLSDVADRYTRTRQRVEERHKKRDIRYARIRERWNDYSHNDLEDIAQSIESTAQNSDNRAQEA
ncbi:hypothetical protein EJ419_01445 [Alloscardovia theropitheci]|uniref:Uncharacterized protein n=1 Tax=Alloscardovia theropitheci TaxID=2496842 RepID=A0A4R0QYE0_9BIFI|nr:hypothetical protein [Alloscardovia theropitheci]TCD54790.1 hypothetical protein EJ419_01445 [Alloscardovia theropitheci]